MTAPLLELRDVRTWFPIRRGILSRTIGHVRAVDGVNLSIHPGETVGLVGESGCGKTTLARTIMGLDKVHSGHLLFRETECAGISTAAMKPLRRKLQIIFQDPFSSLNPRMTVLDIITEGLLQHKMITPGERQQAAEQLLRDVGLTQDALHRYPHEFSGGQRQRISIARAVSLRPELILCDEAVSALDVSIQAQIINLLMDLRDAYHLAYLFISHDLSVVRHIADRVSVMYLGQIVEEGPVAAILDNPKHPYTRALISAIPKVGSTERKRIILPGDVPSPSAPPEGCRFHPRCPYAQERCRSSIPRLDTLSDGLTSHRIACIRKDEI
ncbi:MAG: ATP-binding cassette domain-containing protein [Spartobacteria bacterium]|nr:ATP-binding cassette domain-containing protein [Spartobacteria bacterium]